MQTANETGVRKQLGFLRLLRMIGPGIIIAASIVGPGTVTTASSTGASYGYALLWCTVLTPILAYILEEPCIRWTLKTNTTMLEGVRTQVGLGASRFTFIAIFVGALAYQTGNYVGASMAINLLIPSISISTALLILCVASLVIAFVGRYKILERVNMGLVIIMLGAFLITMFASKPSLGGIASGLIPKIPDGATLLALGLVGTTMCPDIPFALSSLTKKKWSNGIADLKHAKGDLRFNMVLTGVITCAVIICSATVLHPQGITVSSAADMAAQLVPTLGRFAGVLFALGLWAAGFSSAIYMTSCIPPMFQESFNFSPKVEGIASKICIGVIGLFPILVNFFFGKVPVGIIISAQVLNTFILPVSVIFITLLANKKSVLGESSSTKFQNVGMGLVALVVLLMTITGIPAAFSAIAGLFG